MAPSVASVRRKRYSQNGVSDEYFIAVDGSNFAVILI